MTRRQFNQLINELDGKSPFIVLHRDAVAPKYVGVEVSKDGMVYRYAIIGINDEYKAKLDVFMACGIIYDIMP